jgi:hypothetical protein
MSMMTPMEFSRAEYSADHSALFRARETMHCEGIVPNILRKSVAVQTNGMSVKEP